MSRVGTGALALILMVLLSACRFDGITTLPLPFAPGVGENSYSITVTMANVGNLVTNSEVKVNDRTVGTVRKIRFLDWQAVLTVGLEEGVRLPSNTTVKVGQKSLLGAEYLELEPPASPARDELVAGSHIPISRTGSYPETEEVLAATSLLLNGGGLGQIQTITAELNHALSGREPIARSALDQLAGLADGLERQRSSIEQGIDSVDRLSTSLAAGNDAIEAAARDWAPGLRVLADRRPELTRMLRSLGELSRTATLIVRDNHADIETNLRKLHPVLRELADAGDDLPQSLKYLTLPFSLDQVPQMFRGDYANAFLTLDVSAQTLSTNFLSGTPLAKLFNPLLRGEQHEPLPLLPGTVGSNPGPPPQRSNESDRPAGGSFLGGLLGGGR